jgi:hypothetical protein
VACCSGSSQTRKLDVTVEFRPVADRNYRLKFTLSGQEGRWLGRGSDSYNLGDPQQFGCGRMPQPGVQDVGIKMELICSESDSPTLQGIIQITIGHSTHRGKLVATPLDCIKGGPGCVARWSLLYLGGLGMADITVRGQKAAATA